jgi:hypothetical protein
MTFAARAEDDAPRIVEVKARTPKNKERKLFENGTHLFEIEECVPFRIGPADGMFWVANDDGKSAMLCCPLHTTMGQPGFHFSIAYGMDEVDPSEFFQGVPPATKNCFVPYAARKAQKDYGNQWDEAPAFLNKFTAVRFGKWRDKCFVVEVVRIDPASRKVTYKKKCVDLPKPAEKKPAKPPENSPDKVALKE